MMRRATLTAVLLTLCSAAAAQQVTIGEGSVVQSVMKLRPGEFVWTPDIAPSGPMLLLVNVRAQRAVLFRNGVPIGATTARDADGSLHRPAETGRALL